MKVLCIGHATYDIMIDMDEYPKENTKNRIKKMLGCGGGQASNAAYLLGKWGIDTTFIGLVGNDKLGHLVKKELEQVNINTDYLEMNGQTTVSYIIVNSQNGSRTTFTYHPTDFKMQSIEENINPDIILMDGYEDEIAHKLLDKYPHCISVLDAEKNTDSVIELGKRATYVVSSKSFLEKFSNIKIVDDSSLKKALEYGSQYFKNIIVTLEEQGCAYQDRKISSIKVNPVDSTGAGDIFHGAFVYGLIQGWEMDKILKIANIAGALSVTKLGSRNSVYSLKEVEDIYNGIK